MAKAKVGKQQEHTHPATPCQKPGQASLIGVRQFLSKHPHQKATTKECRGHSQCDGIQRVEQQSVQKAQNKGSTTHPTVAAAKSLRMMNRGVSVDQQNVGTDGNCEQNTVNDPRCDQ